MLAILEPMAFPMASAVLPSSAATEPTSTSGAEVATPTMVTPMIMGEIFIERAMFAAPSTKRSAPKIKRPSPVTIKTELINIG